MDDFTAMAIDEGARRRFEAAWRAGETPNLEDFIPPADNPLYLPTLTELVLIDVETRWRRGKSGGEPPLRIERYLERFPALRERPWLRQIVQYEMGLRQRAGESQLEADYWVRFPSLFEGSVTIQPSIYEPTAPRGDCLDAIAVPAIPGYQIERFLGRGGMGVVFLAKQVSLKRLVALKMILAERYADLDDIARFRREAEAIARLQHPNIIQIFEIGETGGRPYFSMEYAGGGTLSQRLAGAPLPARQAAELVLALADAVQFAHQQGVIHRDLKPSNILIADSGAPADEKPNIGTRHLRISDFGLAKRLDAGDDRTKTGAILGTPSYMAPEQAAGQWEIVGMAADIYSLGAILYECLTGRPPFRAASSLETLQQVQHSDPPSPRQLQPGTPRDLDTICLKCLEKQPAARYTSAAELAGDLQHFLRGEPIRARPISGIERAARWCRRKPHQAALWTTVAAAVIAAVIGAFVWQRVELRRRHQIETLRVRHDEETRRQQTLRRRAVELNQQRGLAALAANRFDGAEQFLQQALHHAVEMHDADDLRQEVEEQHARVERLQRFYHMSQRAELLAFVEREERARELAEDMLRQVRALDDGLDWWKRLPSQDLTPAQAERLRLDVNHHLMLLAALRMKHGLLNVQGDASKQAYREALSALERVQAFHDAFELPPSVSAQVLANVCHFSLGQLGRIKKLPSVRPGTATDCYFYGVAYYWLVMSPEGKLTETIKWAFRIFGLDVTDPAGAALAALSRSIAQDPRHHWSYVWLGWTLQSTKDYHGSELAFASCITLRPDDPIGYVERARALALQASALSEKNADVLAARRRELADRCRADLNRALTREACDWYVQLRRLEALALFDEKDDAIDAARAMLESMPAPQRLIGLPAEESAALTRNVHGYLQRLLQQTPEHPELNSVLALLLLRTGDWAGAEAAAAKALAIPSNHPRAAVTRATALLVHGQMRLLRGQGAEARKAFDQALALRPKCFHAALGRAATFAAEGDRESALAACAATMPLAGNDWQQLEVYLERIAALLTLERLDDARREMELVRALHPGIIDEYRRRWLGE